MVGCSPRSLTFLNSWGGDWGDNGSFSVEDHTVLQRDGPSGPTPARFYDVYWLKSELTGSGRGLTKHNARVPRTSPRARRAALRWICVPQYTKIAAVPPLIQECQAVRVFDAVPAGGQQDAGIVSAAAACQVAEDARFDDLDEGLQYGNTGGDDGGGTFDTAAQEKMSTERESGVDDAEDNDLRSPDDEVGGIIGEVIAGQAGRPSDLVDGDNGGTEHVKTDQGSHLRGSTPYTDPVPSAALSASFFVHLVCRVNRTVTG